MRILLERSVLFSFLSGNSDIDTLANSIPTADIVSRIPTVALSNKKHNNKDEIDEFMTTFEVVINPVKHVEIIGNYTYSKYDKKCTNRSVDMQYSKVPGVTITMPESTSGGIN